ncbi:hypothetical protein S83_012296, partial [Arachis hypogaea]
NFCIQRIRGRREEHPTFGHLRAPSPTSVHRRAPSPKLAHLGFWVSPFLSSGFLRFWVSGFLGLGLLGPFVASVRGFVLCCFLAFLRSSLEEQSQNDQQQQHNAAGQESQTASSRGKSDPAWEYFTVKYDKNNKAQYTCIFCLNTYNGGGIYRMKYHLVKIPGQIKVCSKVTEEVELQFKRILMENKKNEMEKRKFEEEAY